LVHSKLVQKKTKKTTIKIMDSTRRKVLTPRKQQQSTVLRWERRKIQIEKIISFVNLLSSSRLTSRQLHSPGGLYEITCACHVIDSSPSSPLLSAIVKYCGESSELKIKAQKLYKALRPVCNLDDTEHEINLSSPLTFMSPLDCRNVSKGVPVSPNARKDVLSVNGVMCTGKNSILRALHANAKKMQGRNGDLIAVFLPPLPTNNDDNDSAGIEYSPSFVTVDTDLDASIYPNDVVYVFNASTKCFDKFIIDAISFEQIGFMTTKICDCLNTTTKQKPSEIQSSSSSTFTPLLTFAHPHTTVIRTEKILINDVRVQRSTCFTVPVPSKQAAFNKLKTWCGEDDWAKNLQETTDYVEKEKVSAASGVFTSCFMFFCFSHLHLVFPSFNSKKWSILRDFRLTIVRKMQ